MAERRSANILLSGLGCAVISAACLAPPPDDGPAPRIEEPRLPEPAQPPVQPTADPVPIAPVAAPAAAPVPRCPAFNSRFGPVDGEHVGRDVLGDEWPLTVESGCLYCDRIGAVFFVHDGQTYGLNGTAHRRDHDYGEVEPIWREDPRLRRLRAPDFVPRVSISPLIERGLRLCSTGR